MNNEPYDGPPSPSREESPLDDVLSMALERPTGCCPGNLSTSGAWRLSSQVDCCDSMRK